MSKEATNEKPWGVTRLKDDEYLPLNTDEFVVISGGFVFAARKDRVLISDFSSKNFVVFKNKVNQETMLFPRKRSVFYGLTERDISIVDDFDQFRR